MNVPFWVLLVLVIFEDSCLTSQFCRTDSSDLHEIVTPREAFPSDQSVRHCTESQSCEIDSRMSDLTIEQKQIISSLYKNGRKIVNTKSHLEYLNRSLEFNFIPACFKITKVIPGNQAENQESFDNLSIECIKKEKARFEEKLEELDD